MISEPMCNPAIEKCGPRGIVDRMNDEIQRLEERLARLKRAKQSVDANPEIAAILNELTKLL